MNEKKFNTTAAQIVIFLVVVLAGALVARVVIGTIHLARVAL